MSEDRPSRSDAGEILQRMEITPVWVVMKSGPGEMVGLTEHPGGPPGPTLFLNLEEALQVAQAWGGRVAVLLLSSAVVLCRRNGRPAWLKPKGHDVLQILYAPTVGTVN